MFYRRARGERRTLKGKAKAKVKAEKDSSGFFFTSTFTSTCLSGVLYDNLLVNGIEGRSPGAPSTTTSSSTTTPTAFGARASLIDVKRSSLQLRAVQIVDRGLGFSFIGHLHESEPS